MRTAKIIAPASIAIALIGGGTTLAYITANDQPKKPKAHIEIVSPAVDIAETQQTKPAETTIAAPAQPVADPCTTQKTETENNTGTDVHNSKTTLVHCESHDKTDSTVVDVHNTTNQSATAGSSTGRTGSASNSNTFKLDIKINH